MSPKVAEVLFVTTKYVFRYYPSGYQAIYCDIGYQGGGGYHPLRFCVKFKILYLVIQRLIQHCLLSKMVYLNVKYIIATRSYEFFTYTQNLIGNITLSRVIISVASVNRGTKYIKRYENVALHSLYGMA